MVQIAVVYHSGYGHTAAQAKAVAAGASAVADTQVTLLTVEEVAEKWDVLDGADAIIFGSPTYMGSVSGPFKMFMDSTSRRWMDQKWRDKVAAGFTNSGSLSGDKLNSLVQMAVFAAQHCMIWVGTGVSPTGRGDDDINRIGSYLGAMAQSDHGNPEPQKGDLRTAEILGERVAVTAKRWAGKS